ncbi:hypothetical protein GCM10011611_05510 [Aliidongia dinghuensis]|uniref:Uncharacterized protein n=1 Tax=Aliidongia dinghuensis TaxID=1867774 RepID=A0A8J3E1P6_9PROT|nr:hypothetical protein GCM10011611_05510 [Aliidongia dinghuensis]
MTTLLDRIERDTRPGRESAAQHQAARQARPERHPNDLTHPIPLIADKARTASKPIEAIQECECRFGMYYAVDA